MSSFFLTFNREKARENNKSDFGWQDPTVYIEAGFKQVLTGSNDFLNIGDTVYIYSAIIDDIPGTNGLYGVGEVVNILSGEENARHAVVKLEEYGIPVVKTDSKNRDFFMELCNLARPDFGYHELNDATTEKLNAILEENKKK